MAKVKLNDGQFTTIQEHIDTAKQLMTEAIDDIWQTNFENLYNNFISNGFLEDLYQDSESKYHAIMGASGIIIGTVGAVGAGIHIATGVTASAIFACCGWIVAIPIWGWIIAGAIAIACLAVGICHVVKANTTPDWKYEAREIFTSLLEQCVAGAEYNYQASSNLEMKLEYCKLALQAVLVAIADFNAQYANLSDAANAVGLGDKVQYADDGITVTNINTTITVDGNEKQTTISEALNAFYTYTATVTAAEIEAEYLHEKYPDANIDYLGIVKNGNAFISDALDSGLFTKEFIDTLLPTYTANLDEAKDSTSKKSCFNLDTLEDLLNHGKGLLGDIGLYAGLIGTPFITADNWPDDIRRKDDVTPDTTPDTNPDTNPDTTPSKTPDPDPVGCGGCGKKGGSCGGGGCGGGRTPTPSNPTNPTTPPTTPGTTPDTNPDTNPDTDPEGNKVEIDPVDETKIPEDEYKFEYGMGDNVDYDKLAREEYEFGQKAEEIAKHQQELLEEIEKAYADGNMDSLRKKLQDYGFSTPEIEAILADKYQCIKTIMYCDKRDILAAKAKELAAADGVKDYDTKFDERIDYDNELSGDKPNDLLMLASEDDKCVKAYGDMNKAKEDYQKAIEQANPTITKVNQNKKAMEEIKAKYEKEFKSDDTTKWSEEAAKAYNDSIKTYNESVKEASTQMAAVEAAKTAYTEARTTFENAEKAYYEQIKTDHTQQQAQQQQQQDTATPEGDQNRAVEANDGNNNNGNESNGQNDESKTDLHTDNVMVDNNGDVVFDMNNNGQVEGATLDTGSVNINDPVATDTSQDTLNTSDIDNLIV